jgi:hypothetical protein
MSTNSCRLLMITNRTWKGTPDPCMSYDTCTATNKNAPTKYVLVQALTEEDDDVAVDDEGNGPLFEDFCNESSPQLQVQEPANSVSLGPVR